jgi:hypothetical protein
MSLSSTNVGQLGPELRGGNITLQSVLSKTDPSTRQTKIVCTRTSFVFFSSFDVWGNEKELSLLLLSLYALFYFTSLVLDSSSRGDGFPYFPLCNSIMVPYHSQPTKTSPFLEKHSGPRLLGGRPIRGTNSCRTLCCPFQLLPWWPWRTQGLSRSFTGSH